MLVYHCFYSKPTDVSNLVWIVYQGQKKKQNNYKQVNTAQCNHIQIRHKVIHLKYEIELCQPIKNKLKFNIIKLELFFGAFGLCIRSRCVVSAVHSQNSKTVRLSSIQRTSFTNSSTRIVINNDVENNKPKRSALVRYLIENSHTFDFENSRVLQMENKHHKRMVLEEMHIK